MQTFVELRGRAAAIVCRRVGRALSTTLFCQRQEEEGNGAAFTSPYCICQSEEEQRAFRRDAPVSLGANGIDDLVRNFDEKRQMSFFNSVCGSPPAGAASADDGGLCGTFQSVGFGPSPGRTEEHGDEAFEIDGNDPGKPWCGYVTAQEQHDAAAPATPQFFSSDTLATEAPDDDEFVVEDEEERRSSFSVFCPVLRLPLSPRSLRKKKAKEPRRLDADEVLKNIGEGAFSQVLLVRKVEEPDAGRVFAMKTISKLADNKSYFERCIRERVALGMMESPFVVTLRYAFQTPAGLYSLTDYWEGGSLESHLPEGGMDEDRARFHAAELLLALKHVHDHKIVHRDLKLTNILLDGAGHVALTDFGLCAPNVPLEAQPLHSFCGSVEYMAPEILKGHRYGHAVDWWAFGVLLYELVHGVTPFTGHKARVIMESILKGPPEIAPGDSEEFAHSLSQLLEKKPEERAGFGTKGGKDVMNLPFFYKVDWAAMRAMAAPVPYVPQHAEKPRPSLAAMPQDSFSALAHEFAENKNSAPADRKRLKRFSFAGKPIPASP
ncbi:serine/threonine kinase [Aureococcus anophagefferens]|nr:serine/threonine kinase [Aureococcus anophagefferens]